MKEYVCWVFLISLAGTILAGLYNRLSLTKYRVSNVRIPDGFDGYRIAVVSDLHAERFGKKQQELIALLRKVPCDLICLTGDIISRDAADFAPVWAFIDAMAGIPMVYISGNHEPSLEDYDLLLNGLSRRGVTVLDGLTRNTLTLKKGADSILIHGYPFTDTRRLSDHIPAAQKGSFNILLYHDPYCFPDAALLDYDLMLSGHLHGGIVRLPLLGSPLELLGIEPFTKGVYTNGAATLVVSGGLGSHRILPRFFSASEVVLVTLDASKDGKNHTMRETQ